MGGVRVALWHLPLVCGTSTSCRRDCACASDCGSSDAFGRLLLLPATRAVWFVMFLSARFCIVVGYRPTVIYLSLLGPQLPVRH